MSFAFARARARSSVLQLPFRPQGTYTVKWRSNPIQHPVQTLRNVPGSRRNASTAAEASSIVTRLRNAFYGATLLLGFGFIYIYLTDTRASAHKWIVIPALRLVYRDPEEAHEAGNHALKMLYQFGLYPRERGDPDKSQDLSVEVFGHLLRNPIGTSAGIDKHADIPDPLFALGPAIIELGGTTPMPQDGNEKPRVFRLTSQNAMINRYGLNSEGADHVAMRLRHRVREHAYSLGLGHDEIAEKLVLNGHTGVPPGSLTEGKLLAVNIAKNKFTPPDDIEAVASDYVYCVEALGPYADILVVNVSSPNTPGLRTLQQADPLTKILTRVVQAAKSTDRKTKPAIMVKVSPDEDSDEQIAGICEAVWAAGVDGVVVGNTTNRRPEPLPHFKDLTPFEEQHLLEQGGFSGPHLFEKTVSLVKRYQKLLSEKPADFETPSSSREILETELKELVSNAKDAATAKPAEDQNPVIASIDSGKIPAKNVSDKAESEKQPLINLPSTRFYDQSKSEQNELKSAEEIKGQQSKGEDSRSLHLKSIQEAIDRLPPKAERDSAEQPKVLFATGGITNGKQALDVLNAGASVAMVYTALVYGGVGTISRMKDEMRHEMKKKGETPKS